MRAEVTSVKVALREEGVGRNHDVLIAWAALLVALRVEGVDRNSGSAEREKLPLRASLNRGWAKTTASNCLQAAKEERAFALSSLLSPTVLFHFTTL